MLEDLHAGSRRVVPEQVVEVFEAGSNPARRRPREIQARFWLEHGQFETESLKRGLDRLELAANGERVAAGKEADEIPGFAFESNKPRFLKDPDSGRRRPVPRPPAEWIRQDRPELRIVDDEL